MLHRVVRFQQVETSEGEELARRFSCVCFREVSAAETDESDHYSSSSSPPRLLDTPVEELNLTGIFTQLIREARLHKIRQQDANNNAESPPGVQGNNNNNNNSRQRKRSVFTINRMLGSLMGRNSSMPPDLPSARAKGGASNLGSSMPNVAGSFRSVFKKRSVWMTQKNKKTNGTTHSSSTKMLLLCNSMSLVWLPDRFYTFDSTYIWRLWYHCVYVTCTNTTAVGRKEELEKKIFIWPDLLFWSYLFFYYYRLLYLLLQFHPP